MTNLTIMGRSIDTVLDSYSSFELSCVNEKGKIIGKYHIDALDKRHNPRKIDIKCHRVRSDDDGCTNERCEFYDGKWLTLDNLGSDDVEALKKEKSISYYRFRFSPINR